FFTEASRALWFDKISNGLPITIRLLREGHGFHSATHALKIGIEFCLKSSAVGRKAAVAQVARENGCEGSTDFFAFAEPFLSRDSMLKICSGVLPTRSVVAGIHQREPGQNAFDYPRRILR